MKQVYTIRFRLLPRIENYLVFTHGYKKRSLPLRLRSNEYDNLITYTKKITVDNIFELKEKYAIEKKNIEYEIDRDPILGKRFVGIVDVQEYHDELFSYIWK